MLGVILIVRVDHKPTAWHKTKAAASNAEAGVFGGRQRVVQ